MSNENGVERLINECSRRLQKLKEQKAKFGLNTPPHILTEIEDTEAELEELQLELADLEATGKTKPSVLVDPSQQSPIASTNPSSLKNLSAGIIIAVMVGVILAFILREGIFIPASTPTPTLVIATDTLVIHAPTVTLAPTDNPTAIHTPIDTPVPDTPVPIVESHLSTDGSTDAVQPSATATTTPNPSPTADGLKVYDAFDDDCINTRLWRELAVWNGPTPSPRQANGCWDLAEYGFDERDGHLYLTCSNPDSRDNRTYYLFWQPDQTFSDVKLNLTVESVQTGFGTIGLLFNLEDEWSYYTLWYGGEFGLHNGHIVFETEGRSGENKVLPDPNTTYPLPAIVKLRLHWDGTNLHFYVDGREVMTEPTQTYGHTLGIVCSMGWNEDNSDYIVTGYIDEVKIKYR